MGIKRLECQLWLHVHSLWASSASLIRRVVSSGSVESIDLEGLSTSQWLNRCSHMFLQEIHKHRLSTHRPDLTYSCLLYYCLSFHNLGKMSSLMKMPSQTLNPKTGTNRPGCLLEQEFSVTAPTPLVIKTILKQYRFVSLLQCKMRCAELSSTDHHLEQFLATLGDQP